MPIWPTPWRIGLACLLALTTWSAHAQKQAVIYSREIATADMRLEYPARLLELALKHAGTGYDVRPAARPMPQGAALTRLAAGAGVDVVWSMTSKDREAQLLPIRIPLDKGLFGYRVVLVREQHQDIFAHVKTLDDLRAFSAGQGHDWPDTAILQSNGIKVVTSTTPDGLFAMLQAGRFDYFPRSILEIWDETALIERQHLIVEDKVLLHYPAAIYFFVNKENTALANAIEIGLNKAIANGSFDALFYERFGEVIKRANLRGRVPIALNNPLLPAATPLGRKALWLDPANLPK